MTEDIDMEKLRSDLAEVKASQIFFREAVSEMKGALNDTSRELHDAALSLKEVAFHIGNAQGRLAGVESDVKILSGKIDSLESTRDRQNGMITIIGIVGGFVGGMIMWVINHFFK
jgi:chromosome segregation ATPase